MVYIAKKKILLFYELFSGLAAVNLHLKSSKHIFKLFISINEFDILVLSLFFSQLKLCSMKPIAPELKSFKWNDFKIETDYEYYKAKDFLDYDSVADC